MGGGAKAPSADPRIGQAAMKSAEVGEEYFNWMKEQAAVTNGWAAEDRERWEDVFRPMQDDFIQDAKTWDTPGRRQAAQKQAVGDVRMQSAIGRGTRVRQAMAMGVNPNSGNYQAAEARAGQADQLAAAGASNMARRTVRQEGEAKKAQAINLGSGLAVNPLSSMQAGSGAMQAGASGAMQGYNQQGSLLNTQYQQQAQAAQASGQGQAAWMQGLGTIGGMLMMSSKDSKENKKPLKDGEALAAVRGLPIERWDYKEGKGDGGKGHIGAYAEDFQKATGQGDGKTIPVVSAIGVTMGAVKDVAAKVDKLAATIARGLPERMAA